MTRSSCMGSSVRREGDYSREMSGGIPSPETQKNTTELYEQQSHIGKHTARTDHGGCEPSKKRGRCSKRHTEGSHALYEKLDVWLDWGAGCGKTASPDLSGGRSAMVVPTAPTGAYNLNSAHLSHYKVARRPFSHYKSDFFIFARTGADFGSTTFLTTNWARIFWWHFF